MVQFPKTKKPLSAAGLRCNRHRDGSGGSIAFVGDATPSGRRTLNARPMSEFRSVADIGGQLKAVAQALLAIRARRTSHGASRPARRMVKNPLNVAREFDDVAKRVGEVCALSSDAWSGHRGLADLHRAEETLTEDIRASRAPADATASVVALPLRASNLGTPTGGDDDATMLALQLCEQVREYRRSQPKGAGANVVWLFR